MFRKSIFTTIAAFFVLVVAVPAAALSPVTFSGASQVGKVVTTWTVGFKTLNNNSAILLDGGTITVVFPSGFTIPATPTITLGANFVKCTATGATTGSTVTITLANSGGTCKLDKK